MIKKSKYSKEFKDSTVQLILNDKENVVQVAEDLGLNSKTLYHWVTAYKKAHNIPTRESLTTTEPLEVEVKHLIFQP
ncbi:MAG: transposase [Campylobacteraceae bacterium]|nr:transposase [Campylobacteraceae bacterium]